MEESAAPLLEKEHLAMLDSKAQARYKTRATAPWRVRILSVLLPLTLVLGFLVAFAHHRHSCPLSLRPPADLVTESPASTASASKRAESSTVAAAVGATPVLECFQVAQPVLTPDGPATERSPGPSDADGAVTVKLMDHIFGNSYGAPFVGSYTPPSIPFNRVVMNFTVVSEGRQFDRLALMYLNDTEVWRTSTAEPVRPPGIRWVYLKDMTAYLALWRRPQKVIFDLGNLQNDVYTGSFNVTLTATFFQSDKIVASSGDSGAPPSDIIIPISARKSAVNGVSQFTLPADTATNTIADFPQNARRAVFSVSANGQAAEEFWWQNVLQSDTLTFNATAGAFPGFSPFREVQVLIDGQLAGVQWPFPVIFTGGVVPGLHRPIAGIDVFDLREHEIDITPWLPVLSDGKPHTFSILVAGLDDEGQPSGTTTLTKTVANSWYVTGKIFVWLNEDMGGVSYPTTGSPPIVSDGGLEISVTQNLQQNATGANMTLEYTVSVKRSLSVQGSLKSESYNGKRSATWSQSLSYSNQGLVSDFGNSQINTFMVHGIDRATGQVYGDRSEEPYVYTSDYKFPLFCNTTTNITAEGNLTLWAALEQGLSLRVWGPSVFPTGLEAFSSGTGAEMYVGGSQLDSNVQGTAYFYQTGDGKNSSGFGSTNQVLTLSGSKIQNLMGSSASVPLYSRNVTAVNQTILFDHETIASVTDTSTTEAATSVAPASLSNPAYQFAQAPLNGGTGPRVFMGRGGANPAVAVGTDGMGYDGVPAAGAVS
ncbi:hypothetical protein SEUCBS140593_003907 [Sporothrix eucalyptigena]|uniref:Peptide N-acetyl-beta-D-glucosaminyl asparaginase amidase A N-terminal domain-containing protein n=1 Tax=Sporothrix eucalyptigena TaxID=1812306 RepID=A0ABP0BIQ3_9PEZI